MNTISSLKDPVAVDLPLDNGGSTTSQVEESSKATGSTAGITKAYSECKLEPDCEIASTGSPRRSLADAWMFGGRVASRRQSPSLQRDLASDASESSIRTEPDTEPSLGLKLVPSTNTLNESLPTSSPF
jgi:hypothetical protein